MSIFSLWRLELATLDESLAPNARTSKGFDPAGTLARWKV
jgi:hypothetical protein